MDVRTPRGAPGRWLTVALIMAIAAAGGWIQLQVHVNHDVAWVVYSAGWLLDGARFGSDILAANPPLIWWLSLPAAAWSRVSGMAQGDAMRLFAWLLCLASVFGVRQALAAWPTADRATADALCLTLAVVLFVLAGDSFAQREHLALAFAMPHAVTMFTWIQSGQRPDKAAALTAGVAAGLGLALKPYFLLVAVAIEAVLWIHQRWHYTWRRPEFLALVGVVGGYALLVPLLAPDYLTVAVPLFRQVYWGFENVAFWHFLVLLLPGIAALATALVILRFVEARQPLQLGLAAIALAFAGSCLIQFKGYAYHRYPFFAVALILLAVAIVGSLRAMMQQHSRRSPAPLLAAASMLAIGTAIWAQQAVELDQWFGRAERSTGIIGQRITKLTAMVASLVTVPGDTVYAFSTHPYPGFPIMNDVPARWGARSNAQFMIPAIVKQSSLRPGATPDGALESEARRLVREDFLRQLPRVLMVDNGRRRHAIGEDPFDFIAFYSGDPALAAMLRRYERVGQIGRVTLYRLNYEPRPADAPSVGNQDRLVSPR